MNHRQGDQAICFFEPNALPRQVRRRAVLRYLVSGGLISAVGLTSLWPSPAHAALSIANRRQLKFAEVAGSDDGPGTCIVTPAGGKQVTGYAIDFGGNHRAGQFKITGGAKNGYVQVTFPTSASLSNGSTTATVHSFVAEFANPVQLNNKGVKTIDFGATLDVAAGQAPGDFSGDFTIFVDEI